MLPRSAAHPPSVWQTADSILGYPSVRNRARPDVVSDLVLLGAGRVDWALSRWVRAARPANVQTASDDLQRLFFRHLADLIAACADLSNDSALL
jgi:hypothetical protein